MAEAPIRAARPLSPHLQIFRPIVTMVMSILHRITGAALYVGALLFVWWLVAAASGPAAYQTASGFFGSWFGLLILFGYSWAALHHVCGGIRHFIWDFGVGLDPLNRNRLAWATVIASGSLTVLVWLAVLVFG